MSDWSDDTLDQMCSLDANSIAHSTKDPIPLTHQSSKENTDPKDSVNTASHLQYLNGLDSTSRQIDSEPDEDIDVTLQRFKEKYIAETSDGDVNSDDDDNDKDYMPSKKDMNSSDSDMSISDIQSKTKTKSKKTSKKRKTNIKGNCEKGRKQRQNQTDTSSRQEKYRSRRNLLREYNTANKQKDIFLGRANTKSSSNKDRRQLTGQKILERVKQRSKQEATAWKCIEQYHEKRLDNLLASNGFERLKVPADGDCFFNSVKCQLEETITVDDMRERLGKHMVDNKTHYSEFLRVDERTPSNFDQMINDIQSKGVWKLELADCLPLAVANSFAVPLKIFSSRISTPVYDIKPDLVTSERTPIILAYSAIHGREHFDAVRKRSETTTVNYAERERRLPAETRVETSNTPLNDTVSTNTAHKLQSTETMNTIGSVPLNGNTITDKQQNGLGTPTKAASETSPHVTPHKDANFQSPKKSDLKRKRKCTPDIWKRNVRKRNRDAGLEYISQKGKHVNARQVKAVNCSKCRYKCSEKFTEENRQQIFTAYWALQDYTRQRDFICQHVTSSQPKRSSGHKSVSYSYSLPSNDGNIRVCRSFFIKTLDIGKKTVQTAMKKKAHGVFAAQDGRGRFPSANKTSQERLKI